MANLLALLAVFVIVLTTEAFARDEIAGPVDAEILRIVDGDTLLVEARPWPQQRMEVYVRIRGIDAPELKSRCATNRQAGADARDALENLTADSLQIRLTHIAGDKYFGRILADVMLADGRDAADTMRLFGLVRDYDGGRKPQEICDR